MYIVIYRFCWSHGYPEIKGQKCNSNFVEKKFIGQIELNGYKEKYWYIDVKEKVANG